MQSPVAPEMPIATSRRPWIVAGFTAAALLTVAAAAAGWMYFGGSEERTSGEEGLRPSGERYEAGKTFYTSVESDAGDIAVQVILPASARYADGAPVVVTVPTFFTPEKPGFHPLEGLEDEGVISISLLYPGRDDGEGHASDGENDYGGAESVAALRDVLLFALGEKDDADGRTLAELSDIQPAEDAVGLYAFSHPGIAATNVLSAYAEELSGVRFYVGRENPTLDLLSTLELGHFEENVPVLNGAYDFPKDYATDAIALPYETVRYDADEDRPYFDLNGNGRPDASGDYLLGTQIPTMFGKRYYSRALLAALEDNGALSENEWPSDLATPEEAEETWSVRESTNDDYRALAAIDGLHAMLVFGERDHVQPSSDKPHVHQAFDNLRAAGVWTRLNPDAAYVQALDATIASGYEDHEAGDEPADWREIETWAHPSRGGAGVMYPLAGVLEMADRAHEDNWESDLDSLLVASAEPADDEPAAPSGEAGWESAGNGDYWVANPASGSRLFVTILAPNGKDDPSLRTIVLSPGATESSRTFLTERKNAQALADAGYAVVLFDPEGRGQSEGEEDDNGWIGQDGLSAVIRFASELHGGKDVGVVSFSYGITMASGALARYPDLPAAFLIDWEGPADRTDTGECDADKTGHLGDAGCDNEPFWKQREALTFIPDVTVPYLRLQTERDHAQPDVRSAVRMVNAAVGGQSPWVRLNDEPEGQTYSESDPPRMLPDAFDRDIMESLAPYVEELFAVGQ